MTPDVNVLVAAFRTDHPHHTAARTWLAEARAVCAAGKESLRVLPMVLVAWIAACVEQLGEHLATFDRGFRNLLHVKAYTLLS